MAYIDHVTLNGSRQELVSQPISNSIAASYSASSTYAVGDRVMHEGRLYECKTAIPTAESWTAAHWTAIALSDELTELKGALSESVKFTEQTLTDAQKMQARTNIGAIEVDPTLTETGKAADAKKVGDELVELQKNNSSVSDSFMSIPPYSAYAIYKLLKIALYEKDGSSMLQELDKMMIWQTNDNISIIGGVDVSKSGTALSLYSEGVIA